MRSSLESSILRVFPPPRFLSTPHAGLDISDDGIRCLRYDGVPPDRSIGLFAAVDFPDGLMDGGDAKDGDAFAAELASFARAHGLHRVKVSIPEEKAYLFQTPVDGGDPRSIVENIEFKLEENVPLSAADALFYFEILPETAASGARTASVSVVPRSYIERYSALLKKAGMTPVAFEIAPKAIARAVVPRGSGDTSLIIHRMKRKTGLHVASGEIVSFTSTSGETSPEGVAREIGRIYSYWISRDSEHPIRSIIVTGEGAAAFEDALRAQGGEVRLPIRAGDVWQNALDIERGVPIISADESRAYAAASGLAFDLVEAG